MTEINIDESLSALADERSVLENRRLGILAEIGEKALPAMRYTQEFSDLVSMADDTSDKIEELNRQETLLLEEKARREQEEQERLAKLTCFVCKTVNPDDARFCEECGAKLGVPPKEYCTACSTMNQPYMKFCGECGSRLVEHEEPQETVISDQWSVASGQWPLDG